MQTQCDFTELAQHSSGGPVTKHDNLDRHMPALSQSGAQLGFVNDNDISTRRLIHNFLAQVGTSTALNQIEIVTHFVGPVNAQIDIPGTIILKERDIEIEGLLATHLACRNTCELFTLS